MHLLLWSEAPAPSILLDLLFVTFYLLSVSSHSLSTPLSQTYRRWVRQLVIPWDSRLGLGFAAKHRASGLNEAPTLLDLRAVSQSSVAKSTDGLWDCFVGA